jgi:uncharacterized protein (DUF427 family)
MKALYKGLTIAECDYTIMVEGTHYFPKEAINPRYFELSTHHSTCFWKGTASYYDIVIGDERQPNAAWCYNDPLPAAERIRDCVAFRGAVTVVQ